MGIPRFWASDTATAFARPLSAPGILPEPARPELIPHARYNRPGPVTSRLDPDDPGFWPSAAQGPHRGASTSRKHKRNPPSQAGCTLISVLVTNALGHRRLPTSTVRIRSHVNPDPVDTGAFGARPPRGRGDAAMLDQRYFSGMYWPRGGGEVRTAHWSGRTQTVGMMHPRGAADSAAHRDGDVVSRVEAVSAGSSGVRVYRGGRAGQRSNCCSEAGVDDAQISGAGPADSVRHDSTSPCADALGLSFGGLVAQQLAHDEPTELQVVLVSTLCGLGGVPSNPASWCNAMLSAVGPPRRTGSAAAGAPMVAGDPARLRAGWTTSPRLSGLAEQIAAASLWSSLAACSVNSGDAGDDRHR